MLVQWARESAECVRLSPITHSRPCGTVTGPNSAPRHGYTDGSAIIVAGSRYGSLSRLPLTVKPGVVAALHRLAADRDDALDQVVLVGRHEADERQRVLHPAQRGVVERIDLYPMFHDGGPLKTMTSPGCGEPKR